MSDCGCNKLSSGVGQFVDITGLCDLSIIDDIGTNSYWTQISIPTVFNIPRQKPDMGDLHSENISVEIISQKVIVTPGAPLEDNLEGKRLTGRKLAIEGLLCKAITYTAISEDQPMHTAHATIPFSAYIVLPLELGGIDTLTLNFKVIPCIEDVFIKEVSTRQIFQNITLFLQAVPAPGTICNERSCGSADQVDIKGIATREQLEAVVIGASPDNLWTQISIPEVFRLPVQKPSVESIEKVFVSVRILSKRIINTPSAIPENAEGTGLTGKKLIVEGLLQQKLIYTADEPTQPVHSAEFCFPFSAFIIVNPDADDPNAFCIDVCVEDVFVKMMDSRTIFKNVTLLLNARPIVAPC